MFDKMRDNGGWQAEWNLFKSARKQHEIKHPVNVLNCSTCKTIYKNIDRLQLEGEEILSSLKDLYKEGLELLVSGKDYESSNN